MTKFSYKDPVHETFGPKNSNIAEARGSAHVVARKWMKKGGGVHLGIMMHK